MGEAGGRGVDGMNGGGRGRREGWLQGGREGVYQYKHIGKNEYKTAKLLNSRIPLGAVTSHPCSPLTLMWENFQRGLAAVLPG